MSQRPWSLLLSTKKWKVNSDALVTAENNFNEVNEKDKTEINSTQSVLKNEKSAHPVTWRSFPMSQQPTYPNPDALPQYIKQLEILPPLVHAREIDLLKSQLKEVAVGKRFILQGGDCAERFIDCSAEQIEAKLVILMQMSLIISSYSKKPVIRIGRMAGQYAKPRSKPTETFNSFVVGAYHGDVVNDFDPSNRDHDPSRLLLCYFHSAATLNYMRSLKFSNDYLLNLLNESNLKYSEKVSEMLSLKNQVEKSDADSLQVYTSHEGLQYESALTRIHEDSYYNLSAHYLWIGERTRQLNEAHIEYFREISNPIGVKLGPTTTVSDILSLCKVLNPKNEIGKLSLVTRFGCNDVARCLPDLIAAVKLNNLNVIWICDPMHGNTKVAPESSLKTRSFDDILKEVVESFRIHIENGTILGGVHFELTPEPVTECVGGPDSIVHDDLPLNYTTYCDPRLNYGQALEMAFCLASLMRSS